MIADRPLYLLLGAWTLTGAAAAGWPGLLPLWQGAGLLLAAAAAVDGARVRLAPLPSVRRQVMGALPVSAWSEVKLRLHNGGRRAWRVSVFDHHPPMAEVRGMPASGRLPAQGWAEFHYRLRPLRRGVSEFAPAQLHLHSPWGLWRRSCRLGEPTPVQVYPNFAPVMKYALLGTTSRLSQMGIRRKRRRGQGMEFHQLREYREGDSLRQIDWQATSRTRKLISRDYQDERDQQVIFLLDCGRRMRTQDGELSHFDHTLNAVLLLSHVALRQGDAVGLLTFSGARRHLKPAKGSAGVHRVLKALFDLEPTTQPPDYQEAARELMQRQRKRGLVVLVTNLRDEDADELLPALRTLRGRHLVLVASLRERVLDEVLEETVVGFDAALESAAAQQYLALRRITHDRLAAEGIFLVDVTPEQLPAQLVNRYLDIKQSGAL